jgi:hypothetical protein
VQIPKRYTGPEGRFLCAVRNAALEGPLFHVTVSGIARPDEIAYVGEWTSVKEQRFTAASWRSQRGRAAL